MRNDLNQMSITLEIGHMNLNIPDFLLDDLREKIGEEFDEDAVCFHIRMKITGDFSDATAPDLNQDTEFYREQAIHIIHVMFDKLEDDYINKQDKEEDDNGGIDTDFLNSILNDIDI